MDSVDSSFSISPDSMGLAEVPGFRAAAAAADIRQLGQRERLDVAVVLSELPCAAAGVFTVNDIKGAPVRLCQKVLSERETFRAIAINSGNANTYTGPQGYADAETMAQVTAAALGLDSGEVLVASTGRIGRALPMNNVVDGLKVACDRVQTKTTLEDSLGAADAILTSDTRRKTVTVRFQVGGRTLTLSGMAKGAGMIEPNMATMLAFLVTDANVDRQLLQECLQVGVAESFNAITVDGDCSTNDTVLLLANGASGVTISREDPVSVDRFQRAVCEACRVLAEKIVGDGERITKVVRLQVQGAKDRADAEKVARKIGNSLLVKTSWFGNDPNWGRIAYAVGASGVGAQEELLDLAYDEVPVVHAGVPVDANLPQWREIVSKKHFAITVDLHQGEGAFTLLATDLSTGYVDFNKSE